MQVDLHGASRKTVSERFFQVLIFTLIGFGIILRASKYVPGWSMRGDELHVMLNLLDRSITELIFKPLDYEQAAPFGFLLLSKALLVFLGSSEYIMRITSFIAGGLSLYLLHKLLSRITGKYGEAFVLAAFAFAYYPIYYSAELKQYSSDIFISILIAMFAFEHFSGDTTRRDFWRLGLIGVLALCFSHPAIFVLIGVGFTLFLHYYLKDKQKLLWISAVGIVWAGLFLAIYLLILRHQTTSEYLTTFWRNLNSFMPIPPWRNPIWFYQASKHLFTTLSGFPPAGMVILLPIYFYGQWLFFKEKQWQWIGITTIPIMVNMLVSGFEKFPFHGRLIIYLLPFVYIVIAKGVQGVIQVVRNTIIANSLYAALFVGLILFPAISTSSTFLVTQSYLQDDLKPVLRYISQNQQDTDIIYLYFYARKQYDYYAPSFQLDDLATIRGENRSRNGQRYIRDLDELPRGQRIWFLFTFVGDTRIDKTKKVDEREFILAYLMQHGTLVEEFYSTNDASSAHLFILK